MSNNLNIKYREHLVIFIFRRQIEKVKLNRKILYFAIFTTNNEKLINKNSRISLCPRDSARIDSPVFLVTRREALRSSVNK